MNRLAATTDAQGHVATTSYDGNSNVLSKTDANGHTTTYVYDLANRLIQSIDATGATNSMGFCADLGATPCQSVDPNGLVTTRSYDQDGRPTSVTDGAGDTTLTVFTPGGKVSTSTDPVGNLTSYGYDADGRSSGVSPPGNIGAVFYSYDARGNRSQIEDVRGQITAFVYDTNNRLLTETNPLGATTTYSYNPDGTRATKLDANGHTTTYGYDDNKRLTNVTFADTTGYQFAYDTRGHRTLEQDPAESRTLSYDSLGRLSTAFDTQLNKTLTYGYDANGNRTSLTYDGLTTAYTYDPDNRLTQFVDPDGESTYLTYDPGSRRTALVQGNGVTTAYTYDQANRTTAITPTAPISASAGTSLPSFAYTYDQDGNPLSKAFNNNTQERYLYDAADRLTNITRADNSYASYYLDAVGNRITYQDNSGTAASLDSQGYTSSAFNQITQLTDSAGGIPTLSAYAYDNNGNRLSLASTNQATNVTATTSYTWNDDDRLASVALPNGQTDSFKYDANGIRVGKTDSTGSVRYLIDPLTKAILATYDAGTFLRLFNYNQNPQKLDEVFSYKTAQGDKYYPHTDMLGSVYALSDSTGTSQASWTYDVYGTRTQTSGTLSYAFGFTGREHEVDTGLIYSRQRYYDPSVGSWLSPDRFYRPNQFGRLRPTGGSDGTNKYLYALDNPARWTDPSGNIVPLLWVIAIIGLLMIENDVDTGPGVGLVVGGGLAEVGAASATAACELAPTSTVVASTAALWNQLNHIFGNEGHNLSEVLDSFGSAEDAYAAFQDAAEGLGLVEDGIYQVAVNINGFLVTLNIYVSNGFVKVSDAYIP